MVLIDGPSLFKKITIEDLLKEELHCETKAPDYQVHAPRANGYRYYLISAKLLGKANISEYSFRGRYERLAHENQLIGSFNILGVLIENGYLLAFNYNPEIFLPAVDEETKEQFNQQGRWGDLVHGMIEEAHLNYLHLKAVLETSDPQISLLGSIKNSSPRLFLTQGIMVKTESGIRTYHGFCDETFRKTPFHR